MDEVDRATQEVDRMLAEALRNSRAELAPGIPGECDLCGEDSLRLVRGACARCRDKFKLP